ncbi:hypothetical protein [Rhizobium glycinendophyticum]|uniref:Uncharacterized protein n=1 Tax=Rhizobium glycinendophyticum TaxID=2589807 RepID=A0A504UB90_9HYPH|nr:hypothetical protein [Rhizobium glycinendophyticum]TPP04221.1 hypothetical protein FJQ55_22435 [Rhizobium glycinendophyticum]
MQETGPNSGLASDAIKFVSQIANLLTTEEYAQVLIEEEEVDEIDAINLAYRDYDGRETVEALIRVARHICDKHDSTNS